jgi:hypothetical protein
MVLMFLFADIAIPQAIPNWTNDVLDDEIITSQTTLSVAALKDTTIDEGNPFQNYGSDETVNLGSTLTGSQGF